MKTCWMTLGNAAKKDLINLSTDLWSLVLSIDGFVVVNRSIMYLAATIAVKDNPLEPCYGHDTLKAA